MSGNRSINNIRSAGSGSRLMAPGLVLSSASDSWRRCKLKGHGHSGGSSHKHRQRDSKRCPRRQELSVVHGGEVMSRRRPTMVTSEMGILHYRTLERASLFSDDKMGATVDHPIPSRRCGGHMELANHESVELVKYESVELESRFWLDSAQADVGWKSTSSTQRAGESRRAILPCGESDCSADFSALPFDVIRRIAGSFSWPNLWAASKVCKSWSEAMEPLRQAMLFVHWGKKLKHGRGGVSRNLDKALDSFLKGAVRGCAAAMVDAGLLLWETGRREDSIQWYKQAAELGDPAGQCNLGLAYLQDPCDPVEAAKWFHRAALAGHVRAQYSLALCLQQGRGVEQSVVRAARWYLRAAEGGSTRAMYNTALCFRGGEGLPRDSWEARRWMRRAALDGHRKAQFEHGLTLCAEGDLGLALVFLELATRAGETAGTHIRDVLLQQLSPAARAHAITCADNWHGKQMNRS